MDITQATATAIESQVDIARTEVGEVFDTQIVAYRDVLGRSGTATLDASTLIAALDRVKTQVLEQIAAIPSEIDAAIEVLKQD